LPVEFALNRPAGGADIQRMTAVHPDVLLVPAPRSRTGLRVFALALAGLWLIASVAAAASLYTGVRTGPVHLTASSPLVASKAERSMYGGDAYTGIQNAAADTEQAVVSGANGLATQAQELADSSAGFNQGMVNHLREGVAVLIVGVGILNFTVALSRFSDRD
jgi:hypothetical protein